MSKVATPCPGCGRPILAAWSHALCLDMLPDLSDDHEACLNERHGLRRTATFDDTMQYRYVLERIWNPHGPWVTFLMLNPSTASEIVDDNTIRRCIMFARLWGAGRCVIGNLFAYRSTDPKALKAVADPIGPGNDAWIVSLHKQSAAAGGRTIVAWGDHGKLGDRDRQVMALLAPVAPVECLELTKHGLPGHPLYAPYDVVPAVYLGRP